MSKAGDIENKEKLEGEMNSRAVAANEEGNSSGGAGGDNKSVMMCAELCRACVAACVECVRQCSACANAGDVMHQACIQCCKDCIAACEVCIAACERGDLAEIERACRECMAACEACEEACEACAASCPECKDVCLYCASCCEQCESECQAVCGMKSAVKIGARNSRVDQTRLQAAHDALVEAGATCTPMETAKAAPVPGNALKAIGRTDDELRVANYLVLFGGRDLTGYALGKNEDGSLGEYFSPRTEFESDYTKTGRLYVDFEHALDPDGLGIGEDDILGYVDWKTAKRDERGVFVERVLNRRQKYVQWLEELIDAGLIGNSTESIRGKAMRAEDGEILAWPLKRDTLTVNPMEPRMLTGNQLQAVKALADVLPALKSLVTEPKSSMADEGKGGQVNNGENPKENLVMEGKDELKAVLDGFKSELLNEIKTTATEAAETAATKAVEKALDDLPEVKAAAGRVQVTQDPGDLPFKSIAEQMRAVKHYRFAGFENADARLRKQIVNESKAIQGSNELIPSQGQFLLDPTLVADFLKPVHEDGPFTSRAKKMPVSSNSNYGWINGIDETARTAGNRWGGVRGYWLAEGDTLTKSQPKFRRINWELHKIGVLQYATDELLADAAQLNSVIQQSAAEELSFMVNDAFLRGTGAGQPSGILNGGALVSAVRDNANEISHSDILRMANRLHPSMYANAVWFAHPDTAPQIDKLNFTVSTTPLISPYVTYTAEGVTMLRGRPVVYNEFNPSLGSVGDILLAGMDDYLMWEKGGIEAASSVHVEFLTDQQVFRFIYRVDGKPASYTTLTPFQGSTTLTPYVALLATT